MISKKFDLALSSSDLAETLKISSQAVLKFCSEKGIKPDALRPRAKFKPETVRKIFSARKIKPLKQRICFHTVKGGAGKTTLCYSVGQRIASYGLRTLLIDLDKQANLTLSCKLNPLDDDLGTLLDLYNDKKDDSADIDYDKYIVQLNESLHIIPANLTLANLDLVLQLNSTNLGEVISRLLADLEDIYDVVLFDLSCDFNRTTMAVHSYIDKVVIPTDPEEYGLFGVDLTSDHIEEVEKEWRRNIEKIIVLNKVNASHTSSYEMIARLQKKYSDDVCPTVIPTCRPLADAISKEKPLWSNSWKRVTALESIDVLTKMVLEVDRWTRVKSKTSSRKAKSPKRGELNG